MLNRRFPGSPPSAHRGVTMIEVLVTILIVTAGLLGTAGMQSRMQVAQIESYQRAQAIVLLQDMVDRINANRKNTALYATAAALGTGRTDTTLNCAAPANVAEKDQCEWEQLLLGAAETTGGGANKMGAMNGARGCIVLTSATPPREALVSVVWQGFTPTKAPGAGLTCGSGLYGNEATRRVMAATVKIGCLQNDPGTGVCTTP
jgi:type IV pilus assembly protein PilV